MSRTQLTTTVGQENNQTEAEEDNDDEIELHARDDLELEDVLLYRL